MHRWIVVAMFVASSVLLASTVVGCGDDEPASGQLRGMDVGGEDDADGQHDTPGDGGATNDGQATNNGTDDDGGPTNDVGPDDGGPTNDGDDAELDVGPDAVEDVTTGRFAWACDALVSLPFMAQGGGASRGVLHVRGTGDADAESGLRLEELRGPFEVTGDLGPLRAGESRALEVRFTGDTGVPTIVAGQIALVIGGDRRAVELFAVVGASGLGASTWEQVDYASRTVVTLPSSPFPDSSGPWTDQDVLLALPDGFSDRSDVGMVLHLHGHNAEIPSTVENQRLVEQHGLAGRDAVLIAPQGPLRAANGNFGRLVEPGGLDALLRDAISVLYRDGKITRPVMAELVVTAHSGGYLATAALLELGEHPVVAVHLLDALYAEESTFAAYVQGGGTLRSLYTSGGGTDDNNLSLATTLRSRGVTLSPSASDGALHTQRVNIAWSPFAHNPVTYAERNFARLLAASGLTRTALHPPELLATIAEADGVHVSFRQDPGGWPTPVRVEGSTDGQRWELLATSESGEAVVPARPWLRLTTTDPIWGDSLASDRYGATGHDWLVVDGFDRVFGGSWDVPTHGFAAAVANSLTGKTFSIVGNEAVAEGRVALDTFEGVIWLLGDESRDDITFDPDEQAQLDAYLAGGGRLILSGAEIGYATEPLWLTNTLHTTYVRDDAGTTRVQGAGGTWTFGVAYPEDYPDVLAGQETLWTYDTGGGAAVGWNHRLVLVGFPLETLADSDRPAALAELVEWVGR